MMANKDSTLRLPVFHIRTSKDDAEQHCFTCESIWYMKRIIDETTNIMQLETTFRDRALMWYMKYKAIAPVGHTRSLIESKRDLLKEFENPKYESQCITEIKEIK
jgi:hypothetical protein